MDVKWVKNLLSGIVCKISGIHGYMPVERGSFVEYIGSTPTKFFYDLDRCMFCGKERYLCTSEHTEVLTFHGR